MSEDDDPATRAARLQKETTPQLRWLRESVTYMLTEAVKHTDDLDIDYYEGFIEAIDAELRGRGEA